MAVLKDWICLNRRCGAEFEAWDASPTCPRCGCVKVQYRPSGGHIGKVAGRIDQVLRAQADAYGLTDMGQRGGTHAGESVKRAPPPPKPLTGLPNFRPAPGIDMQIADGASCQWSSQATGVRLRAPTDPARMGRFKNHKLTSTGMRTQIVGRDTRKIPL